jgi:DNA-binding response OmpR family regulator
LLVGPPGPQPGFRFDAFPAMTPTLLCVDDDASMTQMLYDVLTPHGYRVLAAASVEKAVEIARTTKLDLVILDVFLPDVDGFALFERLAQETANTKVPVIMASGCGSVEARNHASRWGAVAFLQKPFQIQQLLSVIRWAAPAPEPREQPAG